ncbi:sacsin N-terminal ATP-binding-like domain-containing protein [Frankia sp. R82]|uniref:sacsin N-terminal ATP-binding-like domain-containing protein n=1 Tax=Frankia sp. R82 TaxID=2950553 RepID=UPI002044BB10|nr:molecular chaperone Hsp90 [Frankia sp. R82]MCM3887074.1 molecular chaperone Hsp90 [Frankia sp. R82]
MSPTAAGTASDSHRSADSGSENSGSENSRFETDAIRRRVLDAWAASPARFREDANAEEDAALGAYRDRLVVELLQNALDAATEAGVPARVHLRLTTARAAQSPPAGAVVAGAGPGGLLEVANTGVALSAAGVEALSTLRASTKRDAPSGAIGRFGAGFAAVLAVTDEPSIVSRGGGGGGLPTATGVAWSKARVIEAVAARSNVSSGDKTNGDATNADALDALDAVDAGDAVGAGEPGATPGGSRRHAGRSPLATELARRDGAVPILRLPFSITDTPPPDGYDTVVRLPLRDEAAATLAQELLLGLDPTLPLVLGGPGEIIIDIDGDVRTLTCRWHRGGPILRRDPNTEQQLDDGQLSTASLLAEQPADEQPVDEQIADEQIEIADLNGERWRGIVRRGRIPARLLADRPIEERSRTGFTARVMVPDHGWPAGVPQVLRAPQPTDEPLSVPVLASVELPLDPSRRHTIAGPLRDRLTDELAAATVALATHLGTGPVTVDDGSPELGPLAALTLVPTGLPQSEVDGRLRDALVRLLPDAALFPGDRLGRDCLVGDLGPATEAVTALLTEPADHPDGDPGRLPAQRLGRRPAEGPDRGLDDRLDDREAPEQSADTGRPVGTEQPVPGLLPAQYASRRWRTALDLLGVRRVDSAALVDLLTGLPRPPQWWGRLYPLLVSVPDRDALGALPVPLAELPAGDLPGPGPAQVDAAASQVEGRSSDAGELGTRMVTGPRGTLLPTADLDVVALIRSGLPLRVVHPDACAGSARDALRTLGAVEGTPTGVLRDPAVREAVLDADPDDHPDDLLALAGAVLALVRDAGEEGSAGLDWLADLLLPTADDDDHDDHDHDGGGHHGDGQDGEFAPAGELLVGGGPLDQVLAEDAPFSTLAPGIVRAWSTDVLERVGVLHSFGVLRTYDLPLDADEQILLDLDDSDTWVNDVADGDHGAAGVLLAAAAAGNLRRPPAGGPPAPAMIGVFAAVRDLELVDSAAWPEALAQLARPPLREVVFTPEPSYTRWWLARHAVLPVPGGSLLPPRELLLPSADPLLAGLFAPAGVLPGVDDEFLRHLGARQTLEDVLGDLGAVMDLLDRLGDTDRDVAWPAARILYIAAVDAVARMLAAPDRTAGADRFDPPLTVRTPQGVLAGDEAVVVDAPDMLGLLAGRGALRLPLDRAAEAAHVLGVPLASQVISGDVGTDPGGDPVEGGGSGFAGEPGGERAQAPDGTPYRVHHPLLVADLSGRPTRIPWRVIGGIGGEVHVDAQAGPDALARALAWRGGQWDRRHALAAELRDPAGAASRAAEDDLDEA